MATVYDIIKGINQAAANAYDGAHDSRFTEEGKETPIGLQREEGCPLNDSRVIDGFKVRMSGPKLFISYQSEMPMKAVHNTKVADEIEIIYGKIAKFLKKEYKKITGDTLALTSDGDADIFMQNMSKIRTWVQCLKTYTMGGLKDVIPVGEPSSDRLETNFKSFLDQGGFGKRPKNDTRKKS